MYTFLVLHLLVDPKLPICYNIHIDSKKEPQMNTPIKAAEVGAQIWVMLEKAVEQEYADETLEAKEQAKAAILNAMSRQMFK